MKLVLDFKILIDSPSRLCDAYHEVFGVEEESLEARSFKLLFNPCISEEVRGFTFRHFDSRQGGVNLKGAFEIVHTIEVDVINPDYIIHAAKEIKHESRNVPIEGSIEDIEDAVFEILVGSNNTPSFSDCGFSFVSWNTSNQPIEKTEVKLKSKKP